MTRLLVLCALSTAALAAADGSVVVKAATGRVNLDGSELPRQGIGIWRLEAGAVLESEDGFVELQVAGGGWLRLRPASVVKLVSEDDRAVVLEVRKGAVSLDVLYETDVESIQLVAAESTMTVNGKGSFLVEAEPERFSVVKGKARVTASGQSADLKSKSVIAADLSSPAQKLAKLERDDFEKWRTERNDEIVQSRKREIGFSDLVMRPAK